MPGETLSFEILARDNASRSFRDVGRSALDASGKIDLAAASMAAYDQTTLKSARAANTAIAARKQHAAAEKLLADAYAVENNQATKHVKLLADEGRQLDALAPKTSKWRSLTEGASAALQDLGGSAQGGASGMGLLVAAGVALAPVAITVGAGLGGLGIAAAGIIGPLIKAAQAPGGLEKNLSKLDSSQRQAAHSLIALRGSYQVFQDELKPVVLRDFSAALNSVRPLLVGIEPVAQATGNALAHVFDQVGATFRSNQWQQFFAFMAQQAGPDIRLLGDSFNNILAQLPALLMELQPLGRQMLVVTDDATKLLNPLAKLISLVEAPISAQFGLARWLDNWTTKITNALPGGKSINDTLTHTQHAMDGTASASGPAAAGIAHTGLNAQAAAVHVKTLWQQVTDLNNAETKSLGTQLAYSNALIAGRNDAASLAKALQASHHEIGLHTAAERASFSAANTYISDLISIANTAHASGRGVGAAITAIRNGLPILDSARTKNRLYWQEIATLKSWLDKLRTERPISERIIVHGDGTFSVGTFRVKGAAAGALVTGGTPGRDSVLIKAMPGEVVVPTSMVNAGAVDHLRGRIPGFGAGGIVPSYSGSVAGLVPWAGHDIAVKNLQVTQAIGAVMEKVFASAVAAAKAAAAAAAASSGAVGGSGGVNAALARRMMPAWSTGANWAAWNYVAMRESGWNRFARNPSSGAYGIPQALPPTKLPFAGQAAGGSHAGPQIAWMIGYMRGRYGGPIGAAAHERAFNWYDRGGFLPPGLSLAYNGTGRPEQVIPGGRGGGDVHVHVHVEPAVAAANPALGRDIAQHVTAFIKRGGKLYPAGVTPR